MPHLVVQQRTMKRVLALVLLFALLSLSNAYVATFNIHYPTDRVCSTCFLNFATSLNWANYYPENDLATTFNATLVAPDTYTAEVTFNSPQAGQTYIATVYYSAWNANETDKQWLSAVCPSVLNNLSGNNKGRMITFTLPDSDASFDIYPFFCQNEGEVRSFSMYSTQLGLDKIIYYYVPGSLLENPISRAVDYVLQGDGFSIKGSLKTTYDFLSSQGIAPEFVVFGPGQGTPTDPWFDGGAERTREMTPWPCVPFTGGPPCGAQSGAGFQYLDFLISDALPAVQANLSLPSVGRERMAVAGWSNGGLDACVFAYMNSSIFSKGYCGSAAVWWNNGQFASVVTATPPENPIKLYLDVGGHEIGPISMYLTAAYQALLTRLELGTQLMFAHYASSPDSHQFGSWNAHTPLAFAFLYNEGRVLGTSAQGKVVVYSEAYRSFSFGATFVLPTNVSEQSKGAVEGVGSILVNLTDATSAAGNGASPASCTSSSDATSAAKITYLFVASVAALFASQIFC